MENLAVAARCCSEPARRNAGGAVEGADEIGEIGETDIVGDVGDGDFVVGQQPRGMTQPNLAGCLAVLAGTGTSTVPPS